MASRAALLGLVLLVLQQSPAGANDDNNSPKQGRETSTSRTPSQHHNHPLHESSGGHRGYHTGAEISILRPPKKFSTHDGHQGRRNRHNEEPKNLYTTEKDIDFGEDRDIDEYKTTKIEPPKAGTYSPSNCSNCKKIKEEMKIMGLQTIKEEILNKLGMKHAPNITDRLKPVIPNQLLETYGMQGDQPENALQPGRYEHIGEDDYHATTTKIIAVATTTQLRHGTDTDIQHFIFSESSMMNRVVDGKLSVYLPAMLREVRILVYRVMGSGTEHQSMTALLATLSKIKEHRKAGWIELDVRRIVIDWFKTPQDNLGLILKIEDKFGNRMPYKVDSFEHTDESKQPIITVKLSKGEKLRTRRSVGLSCREGSSERRCCKHPLIVDFEELGWDWVISPKSFHAYSCYGECFNSLLLKLNQTLPHTNLAGRNGQCCTPRRSTPLNLTYYDEKLNVIHSTLPDIVVARCGCF